MIFVDTGPILARHVAADAQHRRALRQWSKIESATEPLLTTSYVLVEALNLLAHRASFALAREVGAAIMTSAAWEIMEPSSRQRALALARWSRYTQSPRTKVSWVDVVSFVCARERGIQRACTYDGHFAGEGFEILS